MAAAGGERERPEPLVDPAREFAGARARLLGVTKAPLAKPISAGERESVGEPPPVAATPDGSRERAGAPPLVAGTPPLLGTPSGRVNPGVSFAESCQAIDVALHSFAFCSSRSAATKVFIRSPLIL